MRGLIAEPGQAFLPSHTARTSRFQATLYAGQRTRAAGQTARVEVILLGECGAWPLRWFFRGPGRDGLQREAKPADKIAVFPTLTAKPLWLDFSGLSAR